MTTMLERQIREKLTEFVTGQVDLGTLHEWLAPTIWSIEDRHDPAAQELAYAVELTIAEFDAGHRSEYGLVEELERLVLYDSIPTGTSNVWCVGDVRPTLLEFVGTEHEGVFSSSARH